MKNYDKNITVFFLLLSVLIFFTRFAAAQTQEDVGAEVEAMWNANNVSQLGVYLQNLSTNSPDYAPAVVASAFYDFAFLGKLNDAKTKLSRVLTAAQSSPQTYPKSFSVSLSTEISQIDDAIRIQTAHGKNEQDWQAAANAQAVRNYTGTTIIPSIELIKATPKVSLPTQ